MRAVRMSTRLRYFEDLAPDLLRRIGAGRSDPAADVTPLPSEKQLTDLMRVAYWATLLEEEGRYHAFAMAYVTPAGAEQEKSVALRFSRPIPLEPKAIAKLAPSADPLRTLIGVQPGHDGL